jgi:hypothetical protein
MLKEYQQSSRKGEEMTRLVKSENTGNMPTVTEAQALQDIVSKLGKLRREADNTGVDDVKMIINAAYVMCASLHYLQVRGELLENPDITETHVKIKRRR